MSAVRIEDLYKQRKALGGQTAQVALPVAAEQIAEGFAATVDAVAGLKGTGPFYPTGSRTPLTDLLRTRASVSERITDTQHLQALLWAPARWRVVGRPELDFHFLAREVSPGRALVQEKPTWMLGEDYRLSADALLVNAEDRTPIVAELKVAGDQNAEYGLVQALAAAAQLSSQVQRRRLSTEYRDALGADVPEHLDVYVVLAHQPTAGTRPELLTRALALATEIQRSGAIGTWVRRIELLETAVTPGSAMQFRALAQTAD